MAPPKPEKTSLDQVLQLACELTLAEQLDLRKELSAKSLGSHPDEDSSQHHDVRSVFNRQNAIKYLNSRVANRSGENTSWDDIKHALDADRLSGRKLFDA